MNSLILYFLLVAIIFLFEGCSEKIGDKTIATIDSTKQNIESVIQNEQEEVVFVYKINPKLPEMKFVLLKDSTKEITDLKIYYTKDTTLIQHFELANTYMRGIWPPQNEEFFEIKDYNFDSYKDVALLSAWGPGVRTWIVWIYIPSKKIFETDDFYSDLNLPQIDVAKRELQVYFNNGAAEEVISTYKFYSNKYHLIKEEKNYFYYSNEEPNYVYEVWKSKNGKMTLISRKVSSSEL
jgi:hypothetical protein